LAPCPPKRFLGPGPVFCDCGLYRYSGPKVGVLREIFYLLELGMAFIIVTAKNNVAFSFKIYLDIFPYFSH
jgi:hypothetical protein